ncbi:hypothetical protein, partial [Escherichia coli]|uniref:hypothetical protein n=1 Tax=Escherichia coli TaxID=562 RepID=UPI001F3B8B42
QEDLAPSGAKARFDANVRAIMLARTLVDEGRLATPEEKQTLARFSSWGAIPEVFDDTKTAWSTERALLRDLLSQEQWDQARRTT